MNLTDAVVAVIIVGIMCWGVRGDFKRSKTSVWQPSRWDLTFSIGCSALAYLAFWLVILRHIPDAQQNWFVEISKALICATLLNNLRLTVWQFGKNAKR